MVTPVQALTGTAFQFYAKGLCDQAIGLLSEAFVKDPSQLEILKMLAELLIDSDQHRLALKFLQEARRGAAEALLPMQSAICHEALGDFAAADRIADKMLQSDNQRANALVVKAKIAVRSGDHGRAEKLYREAAASDPGGYYAYLGLGRVYRESGHLSMAFDFFKKAIATNPYSREIAIVFHETAVAVDACRAAEEAFRQALLDQPFNKRIRFLLIDLLLRQGKSDEAMREVESSMADFGVDRGILSAALNIRRRIGPLRLAEGGRKGTAVSLCMIVKNEEKYLARCLRSAKPVVDEIIVVDTGSNDQTRDIATAFGAHVFDFTWVNDFSRARNFALDRASGSWILVLDADEVISAKNYDDFRALIQTSTDQPIAYFIQTRNYTHHANTLGWKTNRGEYPEEQGTGWFPSDKVRLFTNDPRIRFVNAVHELVEPSLKKLNIKVRCCNIPVHHFGKLEEAKTHEKTKAYIDLGRKKLKKDRRNPFAIKELAIQCAHLGKHEDSLRLWKDFLKLQPKSAEAYLNIGAACWNLTRYAEAVSFAQKALCVDPKLREAHFNNAIGMLMLGRAEEAKSILQKLLEQYPDYPAAQFMLCVAHASAGERQHVEGWLQKIRATPLGPYLGESFFDVAKRLYAASQIEYAMRTLETASHFDYASDEMSALLGICRGRSKTAAAQCSGDTLPLHARHGPAPAGPLQLSRD